MTVSLPAPIKEWAESQGRTGHYSDASDYVCELIRRDQERTERLNELQSLVTEGIESGISDRSMSDILEAARAIASRPPDGVL